MKTFQTFLNFGAALVALVALTTISPTRVLAANVTVINQDTQPVPVKIVRPFGNGTDYAFQYEFSLALTNGQVYAHTDPFYIPYGKRLVIEHISVRTYATYAQNVAFGAWVADSNADGFHYLTTTAGTTDNIPFSTLDRESSYWSFGSSPIRLYVGANQPMSVWVRRNNANDNCGVWMVVTGHFEVAQ